MCRLALPHIAASLTDAGDRVRLVILAITARRDISVTQVVEHKRVTTPTQIHVVVGIGRQWVQFVTNAVHILAPGALGVPVVQPLLPDLEQEPAVRTVGLMTVQE